jgi:hypothetical protein
MSQQSIRMNTVTTTKTEPGTVIDLNFKFNPDNAPFYERSLPIADYIVSEEEMTPNSKGPKEEWKPFEHRKAYRTALTTPLVDGMIAAEASDFYPRYVFANSNHPRFAIGGYTNSGSFVNPFGEPGLPLAGLPEFVSRREDGGFVPPPAILDLLEGMALKTMLPAIKAELSLVNSIVELKDIKTLSKTLEFVKSVPRIKEIGRRTLRHILKGAADIHLQTAFNILPFLSDISGVQAALSRTERQVNDLVTRSGHPQSRHFAWKWREHDDVSDVSEAFWPIPLSEVNNQRVNYYLKRSCIHDVSVFHAQIQFNYNFTGYQVAHAQLLGLLDSLGVNLNPQIIWNAIPWSFVVDWVASVGRFLDQFKVLNLEPKINIRRYLWSVKRSRTIYVERRNINIPCFHGETIDYRSEVSMPAIRETTYRRSLGLPSYSSIQSSGVSLNEITLGASLVTAQARHAKHRRI